MNELTILNNSSGPAEFHKRCGQFPMLSEEEEKDVFKKISEYPVDSEIYKECCQKIICSHLRIVSKICLSFSNNFEMFKEMVSEGVYGLFEAIKHFDLSKGVRFASCAFWWVKYRIYEYLKNRNLIKHNDKTILSFSDPLDSSENDGDTLESCIKDEDVNIEDDALDNDFKEKSLKCLEKSLLVLKERNRRIVIQRAKGISLEKISQELGISRERVRQIYENSLKKMKIYFKENFLEKQNGNFELKRIG